jgi:hypothetical protein
MHSPSLPRPSGVSYDGLLLPHTLSFHDFPLTVGHLYTPRSSDKFAELDTGISQVNGCNEAATNKEMSYELSDTRPSFVAHANFMDLRRNPRAYCANNREYRYNYSYKSTLTFTCGHRVDTPLDCSALPKTNCCTAMRSWCVKTLTLLHTPPSKTPAIHLFNS